MAEVKVPPYEERKHIQHDNYGGRLADEQEECPLWGGNVIIEAYTDRWGTAREASDPNTAGCMCHLPMPTKAVDMLGNEVRVGDKIITSTKSRTAHLQTYEVIELAPVLAWGPGGWQEGQHCLDYEIVTKRLSNRTSDEVIRITSLHCDGCDETKHPSDLMVTCGVCENTIQQGG